VEHVRLQGGDLQREEASSWPLGSKFMMLQKRVLGHVEVETKKVY
jgi:hypothetical protein